MVYAHGHGLEVCVHGANNLWPKVLNIQINCKFYAHLILCHNKSNFKLLCVSLKLWLGHKFRKTFDIDVNHKFQDVEVLKMQWVEPIFNEANLVMSNIMLIFKWRKKSFHQKT
jgi:hypothetical protein